MERDPISRLLRSLPREEADAKFTRSVMRRIAEPPRPARAARLAFAAVLTVAVGAAALIHHARDVRRERHDAALVAEQRAIRSELESIRRSAAAEAPVIVVPPFEGHEFEYVVDFRTEEQQQRRPATTLLVSQEF
jgi:hypothetical protein